MKAETLFSLIVTGIALFLFGFVVGLPPGSTNKPKLEPKTEMQLFSCPEGHICTFECSKDGYRFVPCGPYIRKVIQ